MILAGRSRSMGPLLWRPFWSRGFRLSCLGFLYGLSLAALGTASSLSLGLGLRGFAIPAQKTWLTCPKIY